MPDTMVVNCTVKREVMWLMKQYRCKDTIQICAKDTGGLRNQLHDRAGVVQSGHSKARTSFTSLMLRCECIRRRSTAPDSVLPCPGLNPHVARLSDMKQRPHSALPQR